MAEGGPQSVSQSSRRSTVRICLANGSLLTGLQCRSEVNTHRSVCQRDGRESILTLALERPRVSDSQNWTYPCEEYARKNVGLLERKRAVGKGGVRGWLGMVKWNGHREARRMIGGWPLRPCGHSGSCTRQSRSSTWVRLQHAERISLGVEHSADVELELSIYSCTAMYRPATTRPHDATLLQPETTGWNPATGGQTSKDRRFLSSETILTTSIFGDDTARMTCGLAEDDACVGR